MYIITINTTDILCNIQISFVSNNNKPFTLSAKSIAVDEVIKNYPKYLSLILEEIYDPEIPFSHNSDQYFSFCKYCE